MKNLARIVLAITSLLAAPFHASAQSSWIQGFGQFGAGSNSTGVAISADGSVAVGSGYTNGNTFSSQRPVLWTIPGPAALAPNVPVSWTAASRFNGISGDGTIGAGVYSGGSFRWTSAGGFQQIPLGTASGISTDGTKIIGQSSDGRAAQWTVAGGTVIFALSNSSALAVNGDGTIAVGAVGTGSTTAALWNLSGAPTQTILGRLSGDTSTQASSVSSDGTIVVGQSSTSSANHAFRWTLATGMVDLGVLNPGDTASTAQAISANGQYILGLSRSSGANTSFIWTESAGMASLDSYLLAGNVDLTGWTSLVGNDITDDGRYLTGVGTYNGQSQGFVAYIDAVPEPSTYALLAVSVAGFGAHVLRRRRK